MCYCPMVSLGSLFATYFNHRLSPFPSHRTHGSREDCFHQSWDGLQAYALPMFSLIWQVLHSLGSCKQMLPLDLLSISWLLLSSFCTGSICHGSPTSIFCTRISACFVFLLGGPSVICSTFWPVSGRGSSACCVLSQFFPSPLRAQVGLFLEVVL